MNIFGLQLFTCKHPLDCLTVEKIETSVQVDEDFVEVTYHLWCMKCRKPVSMRYAKCTDVFWSKLKGKKP